MSNTSSELNRILEDIIQDRSHIWDKYDAARQQESELNQYRSSFGVGGSVAESVQLSKTGQVPDELAEAVWRIKQEAEKIKTAENSIKELQSQIEGTRMQFFIIMGVATLGGILIVVMTFSR